MGQCASYSPGEGVSTRPPPIPSLRATSQSQHQAIGQLSTLAPRTVVSVQYLTANLSMTWLRSSHTVVPLLGQNPSSEVQRDGEWERVARSALPLQDQLGEGHPGSVGLPSVSSGEAEAVRQTTSRSEPPSFCAGSPEPRAQDSFWWPKVKRRGKERPTARLTKD